MSAKVISVNNFKGGSAKTFTSINIAAGLANKGNKVLLADFDPQGNSTFKFFRNKDLDKLKGINDVVLGKKALNKVIRKTFVNNLFLVPCNLAFREGLKNITSINFLRDNFDTVAEDFDYIIFDNCPNPDIILENEIHYCDLVIVPISFDVNSMAGVNQTINVIVDEMMNSDEAMKLNYRILISGVDRTKLCKQFVTELTESDFGPYIMDTKIRYQRTPAIKQTNKKSYFAVTHPKEKIGQDYVDLVNEIERYFA